jgi:hypothetical protein
MQNHCPLPNNKKCTLAWKGEQAYRSRKQLNVVDDCASFSGNPAFQCYLGDRLSWLMLFDFPLLLEASRFLSHLFHFINHPILRHRKMSQLYSSLNKPRINITEGHTERILQFQRCTLFQRGYAVARLTEALRYKSEVREFASRWRHWNFSLT